MCLRWCVCVCVLVWEPLCGLRTCACRILDAADGLVVRAQDSALLSAQIVPGTRNGGMRCTMPPPADSLNKPSHVSVQSSADVHIGGGVEMHGVGEQDLSAWDR